jgi:hypothetical protein
MLKIVSKWNMVILFTLLLIHSTFLPAYSQEKHVFAREDFNSLDDWRPLSFPKIKRHSIYTVVREEDESYLKAESNASASGIIYRKEFNVYDYPKISWRWKISNVYIKGDAEKKSGDDYPIRIYVIFKYDPEKASLGQKIRYGLAKLIYGEYPPQSSLNYIWANRNYPEKIITNPYASEAKMIIVEAGEEKAGKWMTEEVDIIEDYEKAFGVSPPAIASIAIMNDSDNTGESSASYVDYIEIYK